MYLATFTVNDAIKAVETLIPTLKNGEKVVVVGAAFRLVKHVFEYFEQKWHDGNYQSMYEHRDRYGPRRDIDRVELRVPVDYVGLATVVFMPLGNGTKVAELPNVTHIVVVDVFQCVREALAVACTPEVARYSVGVDCASGRDSTVCVTVKFDESSLDVLNLQLNEVANKAAEAAVNRLIARTV